MNAGKIIPTETFIRYGQPEHCRANTTCIPLALNHQPVFHIPFLFIAFRATGGDTAPCSSWGNLTSANIAHLERQRFVSADARNPYDICFCELHLTSDVRNVDPPDDFCHINNLCCPHDTGTWRSVTGVPRATRHFFRASGAFQGAHGFAGCNVAGHTFRSATQWRPSLLHHAPSSMTLNESDFRTSIPLWISCFSRVTAPLTFSMLQCRQGSLNIGHTLGFRGFIRHQTPRNRYLPAEGPPAGSVP